MRGFENLTQYRSIPMTEQAVSPLRRRMIEDMSIRKFAGKTQHDYVQRIKEFATFLGRSPDICRERVPPRFVAAHCHIKCGFQERMQRTPASHWLKSTYRNG